MLGGRRLTRRLSSRSGRFQQALGAVMVVVAVLMLANLDVRFQNAIAADLPSFLVNPTGGLEKNGTVKKQLASVRGGQGGCERDAGHRRQRAAEAGRGARDPGHAAVVQHARAAARSRSPRCGGSTAWC